nr:MAG TPA: hypothetical protein [Bacteriophage sp.]DAW24023.1 MAG TPA: hypothetical protein [Caudoviricetes sp.]
MAKHIRAQQVHYRRLQLLYLIQVYLSGNWR